MLIFVFIKQIDNTSSKGKLNWQDG